MTLYVRYGGVPKHGNEGGILYFLPVIPPAAKQHELMTNNIELTPHEPHVAVIDSCFRYSNLVCPQGTYYLRVTLTARTVFEIGHSNTGRDYE